MFKLQSSRDFKFLAAAAAGAASGPGHGPAARGDRKGSTRDAGPRPGAETKFCQCDCHATGPPPGRLGVNPGPGPGVTVGPAVPGPRHACPAATPCLCRAAGLPSQPPAATGCGNGTMRPGNRRRAASGAAPEFGPAAAVGTPSPTRLAASNCWQCRWLSVSQPQTIRKRADVSFFW